MLKQKHVTRNCQFSFSIPFATSLEHNQINCKEGDSHSSALEQCLRLTNEGRAPELSLITKTRTKTTDHLIWQLLIQPGCSNGKKYLALRCF